MPTLTAESLTEYHRIAEQLRAELRATVADPASSYVRQLSVTCEAERRWAQDPDRDDLADAAKTERQRLDEERASFDKAVSSAKAVRTKALNEALKDAGG